MQAVHQRFIYRLLLRWFVCSVGLWVAAGFLNGHVTYGNRVSAIIVAGLILAAINAIIRPIIVFLSIPALLLTLGLFMLIINGLTVYLVSVLYRPLHISGFGIAVLTGIIIGLVNYLVTAILEARN